jgi:RNA polymerase sigma-70 factor (ECF subfamily)
MILDNKLVRSLLSSSKEGNSGAFEQLYQLHVAQVYAVSLRLLANQDLAQHLTQQVFISIWKNINNITDERPFYNWLVALTAINAISELKNGVPPDEPAKLIPENHPNPKLEAAVLKLNEKQRIALVLDRLCHLPGEEISELTSFTKKEIEKFLNSAYEQISEEIRSSNLFQEIDKLPDKISPPTDLWIDIYHDVLEWKLQNEPEEIIPKEVTSVNVDLREIKKNRKEEKKKLKEELKKIEKTHKGKFSKPSVANYIYLIFALAALAGIIYFLFFMSGAKWQISSTEGSPTIFNEPVKNGFTLSEKDVLACNSNSAATIRIEKIGILKVRGNTNLTRTGNFVANLDKGSIELIKDASEELFTVQTPSALIKDYYLGGNYILNVDDEGNSMVEVKEGWVIINFNSTETLVPPGHNCTAKKGAGLSAPVSISATEEFRYDIDLFFFSNGGDGTMESILNQAKIKDGYTLWNLIKIAPAKYREKIVDALMKLVPLPPETNKEGLLELRPEMMQRLLDEIGINQR